jgi:3-hexulose-6-phosphate synthase
MKLQVAFDLLDLEKCLEIARKIEPYVDRFEIGSVLLYKYGVQAIESFRKEFPHKELLADTKIVNQGKELSALALNAGADWITVMAGMPQQFIHATCAYAHEKNKNVMLDLLDTPLVGEASLMAKSLGVNGLLFYVIAEDTQGYASTEKWQNVRDNTDIPIYIGSSISRNNIDHILQLHPAGIVLGKAITQAADPLAELLFFIEKIQQYKSNK